MRQREEEGKECETMEMKGRKGSGGVILCGVKIEGGVDGVEERVRQGRW